MSAFSFRDIITNEYEFALRETSYNKVDNIEGNMDGDIVLLVSDTIDVIDISKTEIDLLAKRYVQFEPAQLFEILVSIEVKIHIAPSYDGSMISLDDFINAFREDDSGIVTGILSNIGSRISAIIASITGFAGVQPLITDPFLNSNDIGVG